MIDDNNRSIRMTRQNHNLQGLIDEYSDIIEPMMKGKRQRRVTWDDIIDALRDEADWTDGGATVLVELVQQYGWFMLRNAAAIAIVMDIEDGEAGF
jgi:hypothetical protein